MACVGDPLEASPLLSLPDELWLTIMCHTSLPIPDLCMLARANRSMHRISRDALPRRPDLLGKSIQCGKDALARSILALAAPNDRHLEAGLVEAVHVRNLVMLERILISSGNSAAGHAYGEPLCAASFTGQPDMVEALLAAGADVHACRDVALQCASSEGHLEIVNMLIEHGADVHALGDSALQEALLNGMYGEVLRCTSRLLRWRFSTVW